MDSRATHLIRLLIAAAIIAVAAPIAQGGNRNHQASAPVPDPVRAAYTAAWQAYRGLPGGPPTSFAAPIGWARATPPAANGSGGFDWGDAGVGAAGMLGIVLLVGGIGVVLIAARSRRQPRHA
jgi:hypothetical protein